MELLNVTQQDIDNGVRCVTYGCPLANAATRQFGCQAYVDGRTVSIYRNAVLIEQWKLGEEAIEYQNRFDRHEVIEPRSFPLELVEVNNA